MPRCVCRDCKGVFHPEDEGQNICEDCIDKRLKLQQALILPPKPRLTLWRFLKHEARAAWKWLFSAKGGR